MVPRLLISTVPLEQPCGVRPQSVFKNVVCGDAERVAWSHFISYKMDRQSELPFQHPTAP
jgi:hypothetical protein